jgi:uncharacterized protein
MQFAVNYSEPLVHLLKAGRVRIDLLKLPAWEALLAPAQALLASYVHFPLSIGNGLGDAYDFDQQKTADWHQVESFLRRTSTRHINVHPAPLRSFYPDGTTVERICEAALTDLEAVVRRWGHERVIVENPSPDSRCVPVFHDPVLINDIITSANTGFLFDISHARLAARDLGMEDDAYLRLLPLDRTEEIHITGIKRMQGEILQKLLQNRPKEFDITDFIDKDIDHQSMSDDDFAFLALVYRLIESGTCREPWIASMEHGGIGPFWELTLDEAVLAQQLPRLYNMTHAVTVKERV